MPTLLTALFAAALAADTAKDELALVRVVPGSDGKLALRIHLPPGQAGSTLGAALASDDSFFSLAGAQPVKFVFAADADGDGVDELCVLRHAASDKQKLLRLKVHAPPTSYEGEIGKPLSTSKKGSLPRFAKKPKVGAVAAAGAGDSDGDGVDELWLVVHGENDVESLEIRALPVTKNEPLDVVLKSAIGIDDSPGSTIASVCGIDWDADGDDEIAVLRTNFVGSTFAIYDAPNAVGETAVRLAESTFLQGTAGFVSRGICRVRFDGDFADEIGWMASNAAGETRFQIVEPPVGFGQFVAPSLFADSSFDPASDAADAVFLAGLRGFSFAAPPPDLGGTWSATYQHTAGSVKETIVVDHAILTQQAGGVISFHFPIFNFAQAAYSPTARSLDFLSSPIELNPPGTANEYSFVYSPGLVFAGSDSTFVLGSYTGFKKLPLGQVAQIGDGVVLFEAHFP